MKKVERFIRGGYVTYFDTDKCVMVPEVFTEKAKETRGVWFSTVANIDFDVMKDAESFKEYLLGVINKVKEYNMNTVIFQVRPTNDAFYESELNPWSRFITGTEDKYPGFDVLGWFIEQAKKVNIEVHAWVNPYRISNLKFSELNMTKDEFLNSLSEKNFARKRPDLVIPTELDKVIFDPASVEVQEFVSDSILEIARKYDVKAVHIDDYFYPYEKIVDPLEEEKHQKLNPELSLEDFRRNNVNKMIKMISDKLKTLDKHVEFGISPFGIYRTNEEQFKKNGRVGGWPNGSNNHFSCLQGYDGLYADIYLWMEKGWIDYVVPQVYFEFDNYIISKETNEEIERVKYADLVDWWVDACEKTKVKLYIGQGLYRYAQTGNWSNSEEIINQLRYNSTKNNIDGTIFFTYRDLVKTDVPALVEAREKLKRVWTKDVKPL